MITDRIRKSFAMQLVVFIFVLIMATFVSMFMINTIMTRRIMTSNAEQIAKNLAWERINKIEGILLKIESFTYDMAHLVSADLLEHDAQYDFITQNIVRNSEIKAVSIIFTPEFLNRNPERKSLTYFEQNGTFMVLDETGHTADNSIKDWFIIPVYRNLGYWSEPWIDTQTDLNPITSYSLPLYENSEIIGVIRTNVSLEVLQQIVSSAKLLESGYAVLLSKNGTFITHPADSLVLNYTIFSYADHINVPSLYMAGKDMIAGKSEFVKLQSTKNYDFRWMYFAPINLNGWSLGVKFYSYDIMGDLYSVNLAFSVILSLGLLVLLFTIYTRIKKTFKPMKLLVDATRQIGGGDFEAHLPETKLNNEVSVLTDSISKMQSELKTYMTNLLRTNQEKDKIKSEIRFAAQIQQSIVPSNKNLLSCVREVSIFGILEPAEDIGGDLYDAFMINDYKLCFLIADVFGKGIVASMLMTMVQTLIRSQAKYSSSPTSLVKAVNSYLCENSQQNTFVTLFIGVLNLATGKFEFCNAGHTPLYLKKSSQELVRYGATHCTALGIFPDLKINSSIIHLNAQDFLILFTDGVTEALSDREEFYGYARLEEVLKSMQNPNPETIVKAVLSDVRTFTGLDKQKDDLSILVMRFNHPKTIS